MCQTASNRSFKRLVSLDSQSPMRCPFQCFACNGTLHSTPLPPTMPTRCALPQSGRGRRHPAPARRPPRPQPAWYSGRHARQPQARSMQFSTQLSTLACWLAADACKLGLAAPPWPLCLPQSHCCCAQGHPSGFCLQPALTLRLSQKEKTGSASSFCCSMFWKGGSTLPTAISGKPMPCRRGRRWEGGEAGQAGDRGWGIEISLPDSAALLATVVRR